MNISSFLVQKILVTYRLWREKRKGERQLVSKSSLRLSSDRQATSKKKTCDSQKENIKGERD